MGAAVELISGNYAAATEGDITVTTGDSLTLRHTAENSKIQLLNVWVEALATGSGVLNIRSPLLHDNVQGIRLRYLATECDPLLPWDKNQPLHTQDSLVVRMNGDAAVQQNVALLIHYEDLPGVDGQFIDSDQLKDRIVNLVTVENTSLVTAIATYGTAEALNTDFNLLRSTSEYALIGYHVEEIGCCVGWRSSYWGNLRVGGPANPDDKQITANWFERLSELTGKPLIPTFSGADVGAIFVDGTSAGAVTLTVTSILAELAPGA